MHPVLDPEVGSSLSDEYSVTRMDANASWYSPCEIWSRGGVSGRSFGVRKGWMLGWFCGRGFSGCVFVKGVQLGYCDGTFLRWVNGCELGSGDGGFLGNF